MFIDEYIINKGNAYQAALKAGYAKGTAKHAYQWIEETQLNPTEKQHLPYKPYLKEAIDKRLKEISDSKKADASEVMEYLTSVMRKESKSSIVVMEDKARLMEKPPDEKEALKAAELLAKILGMTEKAYTADDEESKQENKHKSIMDAIKESAGDSNED